MSDGNYTPNFLHSQPNHQQQINHIDQGVIPIDSKEEGDNDNNNNNQLVNEFEKFNSINDNYISKNSLWFKHNVPSNSPIESSSIGLKSGSNGNMVQPNLIFSNQNLEKITTQSRINIFKPCKNSFDGLLDAVNAVQNSSDYYNSNLSSFDQQQIETNSNYTHTDPYNFKTKISNIDTNNNISTFGYIVEPNSFNYNYNYDVLDLSYKSKLNQNLNSSFNKPNLYQSSSSSSSSTKKIPFQTFNRSISSSPMQSFETKFPEPKSINEMFQTSSIVQSSDNEIEKSITRRSNKKKDSESSELTPQSTPKPFFLSNGRIYDPENNLPSLNQIIPKDEFPTYRFSYKNPEVLIPNSKQNTLRQRRHSYNVNSHHYNEDYKHEVKSFQNKNKKLKDFAYEMGRIDHEIDGDELLEDEEEEDEDEEEEEEDEDDEDEEVKRPNFYIGHSHNILNDTEDQDDGNETKEEIEEGDDGNHNHDHNALSKKRQTKLIVGNMKTQKNSGQSKDTISKKKLTNKKIAVKVKIKKSIKENIIKPSKTNKQQSKNQQRKKVLILPRSKNGCWTCRIRKKKCSEEKPACHQCLKLELECDGYGAEKPGFMMNTQLQRQKLDDIKIHTSQRKKVGVRKFINENLESRGSKRQKIESN
ncbi:hypothetical protein WICMUC_004695 [Wickerhamomyces mucosus]|uniref:Zn(2)-C6 fungal-type domain-containing protein n=1 Tax=Wickerhamomyces mucosus TaxID=1378264 RepID=A0A9P8PFM1_9ASCO|nr:hypothetical protein WICMUC_004695 [Wickerhamomyces mucosus]